MLLGYVLLAIACFVTQNCSTSNQVVNSETEPTKEVVVNQAIKATPTPPNQPIQVPVVHRSDGWPLPRETDLEVTKHRSKVIIDGTIVYQTDYEIKTDFILDAKREGIARDDIEHWRMWSLSRFERRNRTYAFVMKGSKVFLNPNGSVKGTIATASGMLLSDDNGDGIFESLKFVSLYPTPPVIPDWAKN